MARSTYRQWVKTVTLGEFLGFIIPSVVGAVTFAMNLPQVVQMGAMVVAGIGEGAVLGSFQARVLGSHIPKFSRPEWVKATMAGAGFAWLLGMVPSTIGERLTEVPLLVLVPAMAVLGTALLFSIGVLQYRVLRRYVKGAKKWIWINVAAWLMGLVVCFTFIGIAPEGVAPVIGFSAAGGLGMAFAMAAVTGIYAARAMEKKRL